MSIVERIASEIRSERDRATTTMEWQVHRAKAVAAGGHVLWDDLVSIAKSEIEEFNSSEISIQRMSATLHGNVLIIQTSIFPFVKLTITLNHGYIEARKQQAKSGVSQVEDLRAVRFQFGVDGDLQPCFVRDNAQLHPQQLAEELLVPIFRFVTQ